ncbi:hypothetical protein [Chondromyces crocatus]|uniref:hypothetical protein n=1 Tax=Chondromyces crocatus TaxID=52 RepID=UPI0012E0F246|nr:hypothetical protein [Chondromyces crocatus]
MGEAFVLTLSLFLSFFCVVGVWRYRARVGAVTAPDIAGMTRLLRRMPEKERLAVLSREAAPGSFEGRLARALMDVSGAGARVAIVNELLAEVGHETELGSAWSQTASRLAALGGLLLATSAYLMGAPPRTVVVVLGTGAASAVWAAALGSRARVEAVKQREIVDALVSAVMGDVVEPPGASERRSRRWKR